MQFVHIEFDLDDVLADPWCTTMPLLYLILI